MTRRDEGRNFSPTHRISHGREVFLVQLDAAEGVACTRGEWESAGVADYEVVDGKWLFQGEPFSGRVEPLGKDEGEDEDEDVCGVCGAVVGAEYEYGLCCLCRLSRRS